MARRCPIEFNRRMAGLQDEAARAFASELSSERDPNRRAFLGRKVAEAKRQAAFHRNEADRLSDS